jgi:hypothetical protein
VLIELDLVVVEFLQLEVILADNSFIERLRMNNIFPSNGGNPSPLIGMPDFYSGRQPQYQQPQIQQQQQPQLQQIAQRIAQPKQQQTGNSDGSPNVIYKAPESDKFATNIIMGDTAKDKQLALQSQIAMMKGSNETAKTSVLQAKQKLAEKIASGKATDEEKQQYALALEDEKQSGRMDLQNSRSDTQYGIQEMKSNDLYGIQDSKNSAALEQIGARIAGNKDIASMKFNQTSNKPLAPTQLNAQQKTAITQIQTTRPDLAQYLKKDSTTGQVQIDPNTPLNELSMIQNIINPKSSTGDVNLSSSKTETTTESKAKTPTSKTPTAAELIKKYGG